MRLMLVTGSLATIALLSGAAGLQAQALPPPLPAWEASPLTQGTTEDQRRAVDAAFLVRSQIGSRARSHTKTGLLVGGLIGVAATTVFLIGFCSDADTKCETDEVGRAVLFIAVPAAAAGALIGSLIRTED